MFDDPVFFMPQYFECKILQILNSHITWCPTITVFKNPRGGGRVFLSGPWTTKISESTD